jgi:hypothetical protein
VQCFPTTNGAVKKKRKKRSFSSKQNNSQQHKNTTCAAPRAHGVHAPAAGATATPQRSSRRRTGRRDPRRRRTRHPGCLRRSLEHQTHWRATCSWPPPLCPRRTSRALGLFPPGQSALQPTKEDLCFCALQIAARSLSTAASGTPALRLRPRGFRSDIDPPPRPPPVSPH